MGLSINNAVLHFYVKIREWKSKLIVTQTMRIIVNIIYRALFPVSNWLADNNFSTDGPSFEYEVLA